MNRHSPARLRSNRMGNSQDEEQRPSKRIRLDKPDDAGQAPPPPPPPESQPQAGFIIPPATITGWTTEDVLHHVWMFPNDAFANGCLPLANGGLVPGIGLDTRNPMSEMMVPFMPPPVMDGTMPLTMATPLVAPMAPPMAPPDSDFMPPHMAPQMSGPPPAPVSLPITNPMPTWDASFDAAPAPREISASFPPQPQRVGHPVQDAILPPQPQPPATHLRQVQPAQNVLLAVDAHRQEQRRRKSRVKYTYTSPFTDCLDSFGKDYPLKSFPRPTDGRVNGYVKFTWPREESHVTELSESDDEDDPATSSGIVRDATRPRSDNQLSKYRRASASPSLSSAASVASTNGSPRSSASAFTVSSQNTSVMSAPTQNRRQGSRVNISSPHFIPPHFGFMAIMDTMDRKLFKFYLYNWCPGRSILRGTNLWFSDFAKMHSSDAILAAIQSLAGIYVHDYLPDENVRRRVNERFAAAESRLCQLLQQQGVLNDIEQSELVTISSILSMQDIVLTERRLKKPFHPRWLTGFKQAEQVLHNTDPGNRFYKDANVQVDALRLSQTILVGRAVILAQPMMMLPNPATFNTTTEASRFGFLLYGSESDMFAIHGGCGFSKRLLHIFSQVTFCAARMMQDPETPVIPVTAKSLFRSVRDLRQWSEFCDWDKAQKADQPIKWIREASESYVVGEAAQMTTVTAEAWRIAGMIYLQCRLLRIPRNHPDVVANVGDLAKCISIMPTSGHIFTAQAPLLPVFLLGLLATEEDHLQVAIAWFQQVIHTPVRSSVPPLYAALERIQSWMPTEVPLRSPNIALPPTLAERQPWWEHMVSKVHDSEGEVLCLT